MLRIEAARPGMDDFCKAYYDQPNSEALFFSLNPRF